MPRSPFSGSGTRTPSDQGQRARALPGHPLTCAAFAALAGLLLVSSVGLGQAPAPPAPAVAPPRAPSMVATPASEKALEWLVAGFEKRGWKFTRVPEKLTLTTSFKEKNGSYSCLANVLTRPSGSPCVCFYSTAGLSVPEERHVTVAEFITRANWGLLSGNFEMDYPSGVVRYKTSCDLADGEMTVKMVEALVGQNLGTMDRYFPGLIKMIAGQTSPQAAVEEIERPTMSPASAAPPPKLATGGQTDREKKQLQELLDLAKAGGEDESKLDAIRQYWASATHEERTAYYKANIDTKPDADEKK